MGLEGSQIWIGGEYCSREKEQNEGSEGGEEIKWRTKQVRKAASTVSEVGSKTGNYVSFQQSENWKIKERLRKHFLRHAPAP